MFSRFSDFVLKLLGWKVVGEYPYHLPKKLIIGAPHTSNWDFPLALLIRAHLRADIKFIGKPSLFKPPLSWVMYPLGGMPVEQVPGKSFVESVVSKFDAANALTIAISPEGQRKKINKFKTGFYFMAQNARIPIIPFVIDWKNKELRILQPYYTQNNPEKEIAEIETLFKGVVGFYKTDSFD